jgi:hypothetical protein
MSSFKRCSNLGNQKKFVAGLIGDSLALSSLLDLIRGVLPSLGLFYCLLILCRQARTIYLSQRQRERYTHSNHSTLSLLVECEFVAPSIFGTGGG